MNIVHRIYVGARNNRDGKFTERDIKTMEKTLNRYFIAWTWVTGTSCWNGVRGESKIITGTPGGAKKTLAAGKRLIISCANQLRKWRPHLIDLIGIPNGFVEVKRQVRQDLIIRR